MAVYSMSMAQPSQWLAINVNGLASQLAMA
jgi:hypothetical protein